MATKDRIKATGRAPSGRYFTVPHSILKTKKYTQLSGWAVKLIFDLLIQFNRYNNGDLCAAWSVMEHRGWRSKSTLHEATNELLRAGFIMLTRQGGRNKCNLYALTWEPINEIRDKRTGKHKLDVAPTMLEPGLWKDEVQE